MITKRLIENRIENFLGYGNLGGTIWFIGIEEGFGGTEDQLIKRFKATNGKEIIDIQNEMKGVVDHLAWFEEGCKIQKTWTKLIIIILSLTLKEDVISRDKRKAFQRKEFARSEGDHCVLELMPLPCKSSKEWKFYDKWAKELGIEYLENRPIWEESKTRYRIEKLKQLIEDKKPKVVIFYSLAKKSKWKMIIGEGARLKRESDCVYHYRDGCDYFIIPHPNDRRRSSNEEWIKIANKIRVIKERQ